MASERINVRSALNLNLFFMSIFGVWIPENFFGTRKIYIYRLYSISALGFIFILYTITEIINIVVVSSIKIIELVNFGGEITIYFIPYYRY